MVSLTYLQSYIFFSNSSDVVKVIDVYQQKLLPIFFPAAELFVRPGRKILGRVGNTVWGSGVGGENRYSTILNQ